MAALGFSDLDAATTINAGNRFSYGANIGWIDWRGDVSSGGVIGEYVCSGYIYSANVGWINLGNGAPVNGIRHQNNSASDFGVNHDGAGNLSGLAWGANIGWLNFTNRDATGAGFDGPKIDLLTGRLSGYVYGANVGWISLSNAVAFVQTDAITNGADTDGDGLPDNWERDHTGNLTTLNGSGDNDADGFTNQQEYLADTDPTSSASSLRITSFSATAQGTGGSISWSSRASRQYYLRKRTGLENSFSWIDSGLGLIPPGPGSTTSRTFSDMPSSKRFFAVEAVRPLAP
jgi:hypothetical protein